MSRLISREKTINVPGLGDIPLTVMIFNPQWPESQRRKEPPVVIVPRYIPCRDSICVIDPNFGGCINFERDHDGFFVAVPAAFGVLSEDLEAAMNRAGQTGPADKERIEGHVFAEFRRFVINLLSRP